MKILFFGDIVARNGRHAVRSVLPRLKEKFRPDFVVANAENAAHGVGVTIKVVRELFDMGLDFLTTGNHIFDKADQTDEVFRQYEGKIIRPANFVGVYPGKGWAQVIVSTVRVLFINLNAQVFMEKQFDGLIGSPFAAVDEILQNAPKSDIIIVDFHSEATSEKRAFGFYMDGKVSAVLGTHTHVQTADAQVLAGGTAYISDAGMCGAADSVLGVKPELALERMLTGKQVPLEGKETEESEVGYVVMDIDETNGKAKSIKAYLERISLQEFKSPNPVLNSK